MQKFEKFQDVKPNPDHSSSNELTIQRAKYSDMSTIADFIRSSSDWYRKFVDPKDMAEHDVGQKWIEKNYFRRDFYLGLQSNTPVGTISHQSVSDHAYLGYIYLDAKHVGKGYGHKLMKFAKEVSIRSNQKGMVLIAHPEASWATKAYKKFGFECIAKRKKDVLSWKKGALKPYYEEGFELYHYPL